MPTFEVIYLASVCFVQILNVCWSQICRGYLPNGNHDHHTSNNFSCQLDIFHHRARSEEMKWRATSIFHHRPRNIFGHYRVQRGTNKLRSCAHPQMYFRMKCFSCREQSEETVSYLLPTFCHFVVDVKRKINLLLNSNITICYQQLQIIPI